jgi:hypothetical protein
MVRFHGKRQKASRVRWNADVCRHCLFVQFFKDVFMLVARYPFAVVTH